MFKTTNDVQDNKRLTTWVLATALLAAPLATAQAAEWIRPGTETWQFSAGVFLPEFDTKIRVNNSNVDGGLGADLEDQLKLKKRNETGYVDGQWRFFKNHRLGLGWFHLGRDASATAQGDIEIGDGEIIAGGATLYTELNMDVIPITYQYSFINNEKHELAGALGIHWTDIEFLVDASAWVDHDGSGASGQERLTAKGAAPLPLIGVTYRYNFSPKWTAGLGAGWFSLSLDSSTSKFKGSLYNFKVDTEYWAWNNVGFGAAINAFGIDVDISESEWQGNLDYKYWGPQLYLKARF